MKKQFLLPLLLPLLGFGLIGGTVEAEAADAAEDVTLSAEVHDQLDAFLTSPYCFDFNLSCNYSDYLSSYSLKEEISDSKRTSILTYHNGGKRKIVDEYYVSKKADGTAVQDYLDIHNSVQQRALTDSSEVAIDFASVYGSPFASLAAISAKKLNQYFVVTSQGTGYSLTATPLAYGIITSPFASFLSDFESYTWDAASLSITLSGFSLDLDASGNPTALKFTRIKKDRYGAIAEYYDGTLASLTEVSSLSPAVTNMSAEQSSLFSTALSTAKTALAAGNFTQNIKITAYLGSESSVAADYGNYYELDGFDSTIEPLMLSSLQVTDSNYGETYTGIAFNSDGTLSRFGVSPDSGTSSALSSATFASIADVIPNPFDLGVGFFSYDSGTSLYTFDLDSFLYDDYLFSYYLLEALYGIGDTAVENLGYYFDSVGTSFTFHTLTIGFKADGSLYGELKYTYSSQYTMISAFSFSNIGTTDVRQVEALKTPVDYIDHLGESIL